MTFKWYLYGEPKGTVLLSTPKFLREIGIIYEDYAFKI